MNWEDSTAKMTTTQVSELRSQGRNGRGQHHGLSWNMNTGPSSQAPGKPVTSASGPGHYRIKMAWPCSPRCHRFYVKTLPGGAGWPEPVCLSPHTQGLGGNSVFSGQLREASLASLGMLLMLRHILLQTLSLHLPSYLRNIYLFRKAVILNLGLTFIESSAEI